MTDIVERLEKNWTLQWVHGERVDTDTELSGLLTEAAAEIRQLRADNARLREALVEIANVDHQLLDTAADIIEWIMRIARRALSDAPQSDGWVSVDERLPENNGAYLVILGWGATAKHCRSWAGIGIPEVCSFHSDWLRDDGSGGWNPRGSLRVDYWRPLPSFGMKWEPADGTRSGYWLPSAPKGGEG